MPVQSIPATAPFRRRLAALSDDELLVQLTALVARSRRVESDVVAHIAEVDVRQLWAREAASSMFAYCLEVLHLSEPEAYLRIAVARASRQHPVLLEMLADGRLHLSGIAKLAPHLTADNRDAVLARAACRSKREIEELVAELEPRPDVPALVRKLPPPRAAHLEVQLRPDAVPRKVSPAPAVLQPTAPERYKVQFTASAALREKLERLMALMHGTVPGGDLAAVVEVAVTEKLARLETRRFASTAPPKAIAADTSTSGSRYISAQVRRQVAQRDGRQCSFIAADRRRCGARTRLEFHHVRPHAWGGDRSADNIRLLCRAHNVYMAERDFGKEVMAQYRHT